MKLSRFVPYLIIAILTVAISCAPKATRQLRRAEKLIRKAELNGANWKTDTVFVTKEVVTPLVSTDTVVQLTYDTITVFKDRVLTKVKVSPKEVYIKSECLPDTLFVKVPVTVTKTIEAPPCYQWIKWWWLVVAFGCGAIVFALYRAFAR